MVNISFATQDQVIIVSGQTLAPTNVTLGQIFAGINVNINYDHRVYFKFTGFTEQYFDVLIQNYQLGKIVITAPNIATSGAVQGDYLIITDDTGKFQITRIDSINVNDIRLWDQLEFNLLTAENVRITLAGCITIAGTSNGTVYTSILYLTNTKAFVGTIQRLIEVDLIKWDRNTTITVTTLYFTASTTNTMEIREAIDFQMMVEADRNTPRNFGSTTAGNAINFTNTNQLFSNGSGMRIATGLVPYNQGLYQWGSDHPAQRLYITITNYIGIGSVTIYGGRIWSSIRNSVVLGSSVINVRRGHHFAIGDIITILNRQNGTNESWAITGITTDAISIAPNTFANAYNRDDVIYIEQSEVINVTANGTFYTTEPYAVLRQATSVAGDFTFQIFSNWQGRIGELKHGQFSDVWTNVLPQDCGVFSFMDETLFVGDGINHTLLIMDRGIFCFPQKNTGATINQISLRGEAVLCLGRWNEYDLPQSPCIIFRGSDGSNGDLWNLDATSGNKLFAYGLVAITDKFGTGAKTGRCEVLEPSMMKMVGCVAFHRNTWRQSTSNVEFDNVEEFIDATNRAMVGGAGASFQVNYPTQPESFKNIQASGSYQRGVSFLPAVADPTFSNPIRIKEYKGKGGEAQRISLIGSSSTQVVARLIDCQWSEWEHGGANVERRLEDAISAKFKCIDEAENIVSAIIDVYDKDWNLIATYNTDALGMVIIPEIITLRASRSSGFMAVIWHPINDSPPLGVTVTRFDPIVFVCKSQGYKAVIIIFEHCHGIGNGLCQTLKFRAPSCQEDEVVGDYEELS